MDALHCSFLREITGTEPDASGGQVPIYRCAHPRHVSTRLTTCLRCADWFRPSPTAPVGQQSQPQGVVVTADGRDAGLAGMYRGGRAFLVLGGPSNKTLPLELLGRRGVLIISFNNNHAVLPKPLRPHVWLHTDGPAKFCDANWRDAGVIKLSPIKLWNRKRPTDKGGKYQNWLRTRGPEGNLIPLGEQKPIGQPGCFGFVRNHAFNPEHWLYEPSFNNGNDKDAAANNEWPHVINTMFAAIKAAFYLGVGTLYLLGADFYMNSAEPYAFNQKKNPGGVAANNAAFAKMGVMFDALRPRFDAVGFRVVNCTPNSRLWTFDRIDFSDAVEDATVGIEQWPLRTEGWYHDD